MPGIAANYSASFAIYYSPPGPGRPAAPPALLLFRWLPLAAPPLRRSAPLLLRCRVPGFIVLSLQSGTGPGHHFSLVIIIGLAAGGPAWAIVYAGRSSIFHFSSWDSLWAFISVQLFAGRQSQFGFASGLYYAGRLYCRPASLRAAFIAAFQFNDGVGHWPGPGHCRAPGFLRVWPA